MTLVPSESAPLVCRTSDPGSMETCASGWRPRRSSLARTVGCLAAWSGGRAALWVLAALPLSPPRLCFLEEFQLRERTAGDMLTMPPSLSFSLRNTKLPGFPPAGERKTRYIFPASQPIRLPPRSGK